MPYIRVAFGKACIDLIELGVKFKEGVKSGSKCVPRPSIMIFNATLRIRDAAAEARVYRDFVTDLKRSRALAGAPGQLRTARRAS